MLTKLSIQNYALIDQLNINFSSGLTTITGETGAGKSIILGGLEFVLGKRADTKTLKNPKLKCIIEAEFDVSRYNLQSLFLKIDVDYENKSIIRRELLPSGKSRAFINDTPINLKLLKELKSKLIDIHSQHQTFELNKTNFQFQLLDSLADTIQNVKEFKKNWNKYSELELNLEDLNKQIQIDKEQQDYHLFLLNELESSNFKLGEQDTLEKDLEKGNNIELIQQKLGESHQILSKDEQGLLSQLYQIKSNLDKIKNFETGYQELFKRIESIYIDIDDITDNLSNVLENTSYNPKEIEQLNLRVQNLYNLYQKHRVNTIDDLHKIEKDLSEKVTRFNESDTLVEEMEKQLVQLRQKLQSDGENISKNRKRIIPLLTKKMIEILTDLGMPESRLNIELTASKTINDNGIDEIKILFSANKGGRLGTVKDVASGGELSRLMMTVKSILAVHNRLPTIIFDEIDSGISGEVAVKMANIMKKMGQKIQVISITHLPQIAATGKQHLKVFKTTEKTYSQINIKQLSNEERVDEIAEMLGGKETSDTAIKHAKQLLR